MKKICLSIIAIVAVFVLIIYAVNKDTAPAVSNIDGIFISIKEGTLTKTSATIIITNNSDQIYTFGEEYVLEKKVLGKWKTMKLLSKDVWWDLVNYQVGVQDELEKEVNWESLYGELKNGTYRLVKEIDKKRIAVEFTID